MKKSVFTFVLIALGFLSQSFMPSSVSKAPNGGIEIMVTQGTPLMLRLQSELNSDDIEVGSVVLFEVANPLIADGQEAVAQGTLAEGEVTYINRNDDCEKCTDNFQRIEIRVNKVKAVDGKFIWLYGKPLVVKSKCPNCPVKIKMGTSVTSTVQNTTRVRIR